jgi:hypothetical protein
MGKGEKRGEESISMLYIHLVALDGVVDEGHAGVELLGGDALAPR